MNPIRVSHRHARATHYRRPGGPWDVVTLDELLTTADAATTSLSGPTVPRDILVDGDIRLTAADVNDLVAVLAGGLRDLGVGRHTTVAWQLPNGFEAVLAFRACWRLGAIAVPIHHQVGATEVAAMVAAVEPTVVIGAAHLPLGQLPNAILVGGPSLPSRRRETPRRRATDQPGGVAPAPPPAEERRRAPRHFAKLLGAAPEGHGRAKPSDIAVVLFTAGSTGQPKGVVHTHRSLAAKALAMPAIHGLRVTDTVLMPAPLAHISGLLNAVLVPGAIGMKCVLMPKWNPAVALDLIRRERVTFLAGPPAVAVGLMNDSGFSTHHMRSLRVLSTGGATVTTEFVDTATRAFDAEVKRSYGSTEAPAITTSQAGGPDRERRETDGRAHGETELRIVDPSTETDRPPGEEGELWVRGPELFAGYLDPEQTREAFARGGWFRTGDLGVLDADGLFTMAGRRTPERVVVVDELPLLASGKIDRPPGAPQSALTPVGVDCRRFPGVT